MSAGRKNIKNKTDWNTPPKYLSIVNKFFDNKIELDPCSNEHSLVLANKCVSLPEDGLSIDWDYKTIFINPPYGRDSESKTSIYTWVEKAAKSNTEFSAEILMLIPVATNTRHFKEIIFKKFSGICFLNDTRLKFFNAGVEDKKGAPMACCICYIGENFEKFERLFAEYGKVFKI